MTRIRLNKVGGSVKRTLEGRIGQRQRRGWKDWIEEQKTTEEERCEINKNQGRNNIRENEKKKKRRKK